MTAMMTISVKKMVAIIMTLILENITVLSMIIMVRGVMMLVLFKVHTLINTILFDVINNTDILMTTIFVVSILFIPSMDMYFLDITILTLILIRVMLLIIL